MAFFVAFASMHMPFVAQDNQITGWNTKAEHA
jgi:hypothetical protein